jgi:hypothetical protein
LERTAVSSLRPKSYNRGAMQLGDPGCKVLLIIRKTHA